MTSLASRLATAAASSAGGAPVRRRSFCSACQACPLSTRGRSSVSKRSTSQTTRARSDLLQDQRPRIGRDGCRVPIPWTLQQPTFGFTTGEPWLPIPQDWGTASVEAQTGEPLSTLELYRAALRLRPRSEEFSWRDGPDGTMIFDRGNLTVAVNFDGSDLELPDGELVLASEPSVKTTLPADTAAWIRRSAW